MKEGSPREQPDQFNPEKSLVSYFDCNPDSVRVLRKPGAGNFFIILEVEKEGKSWIIKATEPGINVGRLRTEARALSSAPRDFLYKNRVIIPDIFISQDDSQEEQALFKVGGLHAIMMSKLPEGERPSFGDLGKAIEVLQEGFPKTLDIRGVKPECDLRRTLRRLDSLQKIGSFKGLRRDEVERIKKLYLENLDSLMPFDVVFVHGDLKEKHVRRIGDWVGLYDVDKSEFGSELKDWAWLSIRHPRYEARIRDYLKEKFRTNGEKSANFERAFRLMQIDRLVEGYFTRTFQWRGNLDFFSYAAKTYGRYKLRRL